MQMHPSKFSVRLHRRDGNWIYRKKVKNVLLVLQAFLAAVLAWSFLTFAFWTEDSCSLSELSKSYEQSDLFFLQEDTILKIKSARRRTGSCLNRMDSTMQKKRSIFSPMAVPATQ